MVWNPRTDPLFAAPGEVEPESDLNAPPPPLPNAKARRHTPMWIIVLVALSVVALMFGGIVAVAIWAIGLLRSSEVYVGAMQQLRAHPAAVAKLGEPIDDGWLPSGSINMSGPNGNADLAIQVSGPKSQGTFYVVAKLKAGVWEYESLTLTTNGDRIELLDDD